MKMKTAVLSKQTRILWGLGETDSDALHDAYTWLNQDHDYDSYEEFLDSKTYDDLILISITPRAYETADRIGGIQITDGSTPLCIRRMNGNRLIMTTEEAAEHDTTAEERKEAV